MINTHWVFAVETRQAPSGSPTKPPVEYPAAQQVRVVTVPDLQEQLALLGPDKLAQEIRSLSTASPSSL